MAGSDLFLVFFFSLSLCIFSTLYSSFPSIYQLSALFSPLKKQHSFFLLVLPLFLPLLCAVNTTFLSINGAQQLLWLDKQDMQQCAKSALIYGLRVYVVFCFCFSRANAQRTKKNLFGLWTLTLQNWRKNLFSSHSSLRNWWPFLRISFNIFLSDISDIPSIDSFDQTLSHWHIEISTLHIAHCTLRWRSSICNPSSCLGALVPWCLGENERTINIYLCT